MAHSRGPIKRVLEELEEEIDNQKVLINLQQNMILEARFQNLNKRAKQRILEIYYERLKDLNNQLQKIERKKIIITCG